jgi:hypothetical protein
LRVVARGFPITESSAPIRLLTRRAAIGSGFAAACAAPAYAAAVALGDGLAGGLQRLARGKAWRVVDRARISTGLVSPSRFDWPAQAEGIAASCPKSVAVVMFGANDRPPVRIRGEVHPDLAAKFAATYVARVRAVVRGLGRSCSGVVWVGHPPVRDPVYAEDMVILNRLFAEGAMAEGADWFPSWPVMADADGGYAAFGKSPDGVTVRLRADDGVHMTATGYEIIARALLPVLALHQGRIDPPV